MKISKRLRLSIPIICSLIIITIPCTKEPRAMDLDQFKWKNRLLFLFSPTRSHPLFDTLQKSLADRQPGVADRDLVIFEILESGSSRINTENMDPQTAQSLRERFEVSPGQFTVILVGKDGGTKMNRNEETQLVDIFGLIDSMPMRQDEMRRKK